MIAGTFGGFLYFGVGEGAQALTFFTGQDATQLNFDPNDLRAYIAGAGIYWASTILYHVIEKSGFSIKRTLTVIQGYKASEQYIKISI